MKLIGYFLMAAYRPTPCKDNLIKTSRKLATLVFGLKTVTGPRCARALPAHMACAARRLGPRCARTNHTVVRKQTVRFL